MDQGTHHHAVWIRLRSISDNVLKLIHDDLICIHPDPGITRSIVCAVEQKTKMTIKKQEVPQCKSTLLNVKRKTPPSMFEGCAHLKMRLPYP